MMPLTSINYNSRQIDLDIFTYLRKNKMTQEDLIKKSGINRSTMVKARKGGKISKMSLVKITLVIGMEPKDYIIEKSSIIDAGNVIALLIGFAIGMYVFWVG